MTTRQPMTRAEAHAQLCDRLIWRDQLEARTRDVGTAPHWRAVLTWLEGEIATLKAAYAETRKRERA